MINALQSAVIRDLEQVCNEKSSDTGIPAYKMLAMRYAMVELGVISIDKMIACLRDYRKKTELELNTTPEGEEYEQARTTLKTTLDIVTTGITNTLTARTLGEVPTSATLPYTITVQFKTFDYDRVITDLAELVPGFTDVGSVAYTGNGISTAYATTDRESVFSALSILHAKNYLTYAAISVGTLKEV